jgi:hypothetical protein
MKKIAAILSIIFVISAALAYNAGKRPRDSMASAHLPGAAIAAMQKIDPERIRAHVRFLASDFLEGRGTGQRGGDLAAEYIATQFALEGLRPAGDSGTYMQKVPMVGVTTAPETTFSLAPSTGVGRDLKLLTDYVGYNETQQASSQVDS